jgi:hypothetical protein
MSLFEVFVVSLLFWFCFFNRCVYVLGCLCGSVKKGHEQQKKEERDKEEEHLEEMSIL